MYTQTLPVQVVERMRRLVGNHPESNAMVLRFITDKYGVKSLADVPVKAAQAICKRPGDFARAVKEHCKNDVLV